MRLNKSTKNQKDHTSGLTTILRTILSAIIFATSDVVITPKVVDTSTLIPMYHLIYELLSLKGCLIIYTKSNCKQMFKHIEKRIPVSSIKLAFCVIVKRAKTIDLVFGAEN
jgi:hypothetical protein